MVREEESGAVLGGGNDREKCDWDVPMTIVR